MPLYVAFIDLTKVFGMFRRDGLFKILPKIGCPLKLQGMIESFHTNMKATMQFNDSPSNSSGVKKGCVLAPTLFWYLFRHAPETCLWHCHRGNIPANQIRWQALQYCPPESQDKGTPSSETCCLPTTQL